MEWKYEVAQNWNTQVKYKFLKTVFKYSILSYIPPLVILNFNTKMFHFYCKSILVLNIDYRFPWILGTGPEKNSCRSLIWGQQASVPSVISNWSDVACSEATIVHGLYVYKDLYVERGSNMAKWNMLRIQMDWFTLQKWFQVFLWISSYIFFTVPLLQKISLIVKDRFWVE